MELIRTLVPMMQGAEVEVQVIHLELVVTQTKTVMEILLAETAVVARVVLMEKEKVEVEVALAQLETLVKLVVHKQNGVLVVLHMVIHN